MQDFKESSIKLNFIWKLFKYKKIICLQELKYSNIDAQHILELCQRIIPELAKEAALSSSGQLSLIQGTKATLLRTIQGKNILILVDKI